MPKKKKSLKEVVGKALIKVGKICVFIPFMPGAPMVVVGRAMLPPSKRKKVKIFPKVIRNAASSSIDKAKALVKDRIGGKI